MKQLNKLSSEIKLSIIKALMEGKITKSELREYTEEEIDYVLNGNSGLVAFFGNEKLKINDKDVTEEQMKRIDKLALVFGKPILRIESVWSTVPLSFSEEDVKE